MRVKNIYNIPAEQILQISALGVSAEVCLCYLRKSQSPARSVIRC